MAKKEKWEVEITKPAQKVYINSPKDIRDRLNLCFEHLQKNPLYGTNIKALTSNLKGLYRYRVGEWRVIYRLKTNKRLVQVIAILPRADAYR